MKPYLAFAYDDDEMSGGLRFVGEFEHLENAIGACTMVFNVANMVVRHGAGPTTVVYSENR